MHNIFHVIVFSISPRNSMIQTCSLVDVNQPLPWFSRLGQEKILPLFLEHSEENVGV